MNYKRIAITLGLYVVIAVPLFFVAMHFTNIEPEHVYSSIFDSTHTPDILIAGEDGLLNIEPASGE